MVAAVNASFPFTRALAYARALVETAGQLEATHDSHAKALAAALSSWSGPHADTMRKVRAPEEHADLATIAFTALRDEADRWAAEWTQEVSALNQRRYDNALRSMPVSMAGVLPTSRHGTIGSIPGFDPIAGQPLPPPPQPRTVAVPSSRDDFPSGTPFVHYRLIETVVAVRPYWSVTYTARP